MKLLTSLTFLFLAFGLSAQLNLDSLGRVNYLNLHATIINDIWGYVDEFGNEYGLVGTEKGTSVVDLTDPTDPTELFWEPGMESVWRDLKTFGDYAYVTTEALNGLLIIDLSPLPGSSALTTAYYTGPASAPWQSAHNLYIDSLGYAYIFGANRGNGGVIILDIATDPMNPIEVGVFDNWYVHDGYALEDTLYLAHISDGFLSVVDITDRANPLLLGTEATPSTFTHNIWARADGQYAFTTDEVSGGYVGAFDVSDPANIQEVDRIRSSPGSGVIPHNTHVLGNFLITSWYADGVVIHDATYPYNLVEVGNYDTYPLQTPNYDGCWGAYPYLPSGLVLATDRSEGLFVLGPTYTQAAYLEGTIRDAVTLLPIDQASIELMATSTIYENSASSGFYATGTANGGSYNVYYDKVGYAPQTINTTLVNGVITLQDVLLTPLPPFGLTIRVFEEGTTTPIDGAEIQMIVPQITHTGVTNGLGEENLTLFYESVYNLTVGKWGYVTHCSNPLIDNTTGTIDVYLPKGYYDDFTFDFNWSTSGNASSGLWEIGEPFGTNANAAPEFDVTNDCGDQAFVTGNLNDFYIDADDVDNGFAALTSPVMNLSTYTDPYVNYSQWFYCYHGPQSPDDTLRVLIGNGTSIVILEKTGTDLGVDPSQITWEDRSFRILDYLPLSSTMQIFVRTSDDSPNVNITEAGLDHFFIAEGDELGLSENSNELSVFPNPAQNVVKVNGMISSEEYRLMTMEGTLLETGRLEANKNTIDLSSAPSGILLLKIGSKVFKLVKTN